MISFLNNRNKKNFKFYLCENNKNMKKSLEKYDKIIVSDERDVNGFFGFFRSRTSNLCIDFLSENSKIFENLVSFTLWHFKSPLYIRLDLNFDKDKIKILKRKKFKIIYNKNNKIILFRGVYNGYKPNKSNK